MRVFEGLGAHTDVNTDVPKDVDMCQSKSPTDPPHSFLEVWLRLQLETTYHEVNKSVRGRVAVSGQVEQAPVHS